MIEYELKFAAKKEDVIKILEMLKCNDHVLSINSWTQINYYYDTENIDFQTKGTTIRIRQIENSLKLQIKKKNYYGQYKNLEHQQDIDCIPDTLTIDNRLVFLKGNLVTERTRHVFDNGINVDIDINYYCGIVDYEVEVELPEKEVDLKIIGSILEGLDKSESGKATRYYAERMKNVKL